jgi:hypothetical protein
LIISSLQQAGPRVAMILVRLKRGECIARRHPSSRVVIRHPSSVMKARMTDDA